MTKEMKTIGYRVKPMQTIWGRTIRITDPDARAACLVSEFTGFTVDDAIRNANKRLNRFGYKIEAGYMEEMGLV